MNDALLLRGLSTEFPSLDGPVRAVDGLDLDIGQGETVALVGESGSGKSTVALSLLRLLPRGAATRVERIAIAGRDMTAADARAWREMRGGLAAMVFQEPMTSLNPVLSVAEQITEALAAHGVATGRAARERALALLRRVRLPDAAARLDEFPHRLSGGMRQRVMIAMALACDPRLLIADEPTTALDVTIQAQILRLIRTLQDESGMGVLLITHNLGVVAEVAHRVAVMYAGRKVEEAPARALFRAPLHPYTAGLMRATPRRGGAARLYEIPGLVPSLSALPPGCAFAPRCPRALPRCTAERPDFAVRAAGHGAACHNPLDEAA